MDRTPFSVSIWSRRFFIGGDCVAIVTHKFGDDNHNSQAKAPSVPAKDPIASTVAFERDFRSVADCFLDLLNINASLPLAFPRVQCVVYRVGSWRFCRHRVVVALRGVSAGMAEDLFGFSDSKSEDRRTYSGSFRENAVLGGKTRNCFEPVASCPRRWTSC